MKWSREPDLWRFETRCEMAFNPDIASTVSIICYRIWWVCLLQCNEVKPHIYGKTFVQIKTEIRLHITTTTILSCDIHCVVLPIVSKLVWFREHIDDSRNSYVYGEVVKLIEEWVDHKYSNKYACYKYCLHFVNCSDVCNNNNYGVVRSLLMEDTVAYCINPHRCV